VGAGVDGGQEDQAELGGRVSRPAGVGRNFGGLGVGVGEHLLPGGGGGPPRCPQVRPETAVPLGPAQAARGVCSGGGVRRASLSAALGAPERIGAHEGYLLRSGEARRPGPAAVGEAARMPVGQGNVLAGGRGGGAGGAEVGEGEWLRVGWPQRLQVRGEVGRA